MQVYKNCASLKDYEYFLITIQNNSSLNKNEKIKILSKLIQKSSKYENFNHIVSDEYRKKIFDYFVNTFKSKEYIINIFYVIILLTFIIKTNCIENLYTFSKFLTYLIINLSNKDLKYLTESELYHNILNLLI